MQTAVATEQIVAHAENNDKSGIAKKLDVQQSPLAC
jgi:hypothetical protein